jgi:hypothetical protein
LTLQPRTKKDDEEMVNGYWHGPVATQAEGSESDPAKRLEELHQRRDELDAEIARVVAALGTLP